MGGGTYGEVYLCYLQSLGIAVDYFLDDDERKLGSKISGIEVKGASSSIEGLFSQGVTDFYCPIGVNKVRVGLNMRARKAGLFTPNFIHPSAIVNSDIAVNSGVYILPGAVVMPCSRIEQDVMISTSATVAHHTTLSQGVFLSTGVAVGAGMRIGKNVYAGMKSTFVTGKVTDVGDDAIVGAGAVVLRNVDSLDVVAGVPARSIRNR